MSPVSWLLRMWRVLATGFGFSVLFLGGAFLAMTAFPLIAFATRDEVLRARRAQRVIRLAFRVYLVVLRVLGLVRLEVEGIERLGACEGRLIVANHPTLLDVVLLMALVPNAQCVVKHLLWSSPFLGRVVRAAGYIRNDQGPERLIALCEAGLAAGNNLIIFPEGTRSFGGRLLKFQRGFANIAVRARSDIQPVTIRCEPLTLTKGSAWYDVPCRRAHFRVKAGECLMIAPFIEHLSPTVAARRLVTHFENFYEKQVGHAGSGV